MIGIIKTCFDVSDVLQCFVYRHLWPSRLPYILIRWLFDNEPSLNCAKEFLLLLLVLTYSATDIRCVYQFFSCVLRTTISFYLETKSAAPFRAC